MQITYSYGMSIDELVSEFARHNDAETTRRYREIISNPQLPTRSLKASLCRDALLELLERGNWVSSAFIFSSLEDRWRPQHIRNTLRRSFQRGLVDRLRDGNCYSYRLKRCPS